MHGLHRKLAALAISAALPFACAHELSAQPAQSFELQPGITVIDFVSVPEGTPSNTAFSLRFSTRFSTRVTWLRPVVGAVFFPYGTTENTVRNTDAPTIFVGNVFPLLNISRTAGWLSLELPLILAHSPGTRSSGNVRDYGRDLVLMPTAYLHVGGRALRDFGAVWSRLRLFVHMEQILTPNKEDTPGGRDFFNPSATFGVSLSFGAPGA